MTSTLWSPGFECLHKGNFGEIGTLNHSMRFKMLTKMFLGDSNPSSSRHSIIKNHKSQNWWNWTYKYLSCWCWSQAHQGFQKAEKVELFISQDEPPNNSLKSDLLYKFHNFNSVIGDVPNLRRKNNRTKISSFFCPEEKRRRDTSLGRQQPKQQQ